MVCPICQTEVALSSRFAAHDLNLIEVNIECLEGNCSYTASAFLGQNGSSECLDLR